MKRIRVSAIVLIIAMVLCSTCGCGKTSGKQDVSEISNNIDATNESEGEGSKETEAAENENQGDSNESEVDFTNAEELVEDGDYICSYNRESLGTEDAPWYFEFGGISDAFIEDGYLYIAGGLRYQGIYTGEEDEDGFPIVLGNPKEYEKGIYRLKLANEIKWAHYWMTDSGLKDNRVNGSEPKVAIEEMQNEFNVFFDINAPEYDEQYANTGCTIAFTIEGGKIIRLAVHFPVG